MAYKLKCTLSSPRCIVVMVMITATESKLEQGALERE